MTEAEGDKVTFEAGETLFAEGSPGGDLYFIQEGHVEIFKEKAGTPITLSTMGAGEVIGLFTCLNDNPRSASAKAVERVVVKKVPHSQIMKAVKDIPKWMLIILKEYQIRLASMNESYINQTIMFNKQKERLQSSLQDAKVICAFLRQIAPHIAVTIDGDKFVMVDDLTERVLALLDDDSSRGKAILEILFNSGLLAKQLEPDHKKEVVPLQLVEKLDDFGVFIKSLKLKKNKKMADNAYPDKSIRIARALVSYAKHMNLSMGSKIQLKINELKEKMNKITGVAFEQEALGPLIENNLLEVKESAEESEGSSCVFTPIPLSRTIGHILAYRKLNKLDSASLEAGSAEENIAA
jgi:hypothetical protein